MSGETKYVTWNGGPAGDYTCDNTNDQTAINAALVWAKDNPYNIIKLRGSGDANNPHIYKIRGQVKIGSKTTWTAEVGAKLWVPDYACGTSIDNCVFPDGTPVIGQLTTPVSEVEIYGFEIDGNCQNQSTQLGKAHSNLASAGSGVERLIGLRGNTGNPAINIHIHDMYFHDAFGEAAKIFMAQNVRFHHCRCINHQHDAVLFVEVYGSGNEINDNYIEAITDGGVRVDNSINVKIYNNEIHPYHGPNTNTAWDRGANGMQIANEPAANNRTMWLDNVEVYNNTLTDIDLVGIWINDAYGKGTGTIRVHHNKFINCGAQCGSGVDYGGGIAVRPWGGSGVTIEKNTFDGCHQNAIQLLTAVGTAVKVYIKSNNILNTQVSGASSTGSTLSTTYKGYGICNANTSAMSAVMSENYFMGNVSGKYNPTTMTSTNEATSLIADAVPGSGTTTDDDDPVIPGGGDEGSGDNTDGSGYYIPPAIDLSSEEDEIFERLEGKTGYINGKYFYWQKFSVKGGKTIGQNKSPSLDGWSLTDLGYEGSVVVFDCFAFSEKERNEVLAAFYRKGRSSIELGGPFNGYKIRGTGESHSTDFDLSTDFPEIVHPYSLTFLMDTPLRETIQKRVRARYIYNTTSFSADDCYAGNLVKNPSFEEWSVNDFMTWTNQTTPSDVEWRTVRYSKELNQFCAVAAATSNNIMIKNANGAWQIPTGLTNATNHAVQWRGLAWCTEWGMWVATGISDIGYRCITSSDGVTWAAKITPVDNPWGYALWIPPNDSIPNGRLIAFAYSGTDRVMYSDDQCANWTVVASAVETNEWVSAAYSPELGVIAAVAYDGSATQRVMTSSDYGATWTARTCPAQNWTSITWADTLGLFVAVSLDGTKQIMTSTNGESWTLQDTPYVSSSTTGGGEVVASPYADTPVGYNYTSPFTTYQVAGAPFTLPALTNGHIYRLDNIHADMWAVSSGPTCTVEARYKIGSGAETVLATWTENSTTKTTHSLNLATEINPTDTVTITFYYKNSGTSIRVGVTKLGYTASELTTSGSTVEYVRNQWRSITWAKELSLLVAVAQTGLSKRVMCSNNGTIWNHVTNTPTNNWVSVTYANAINALVAVANSGTGNRAMYSDDYGTYTNTAPEYWAKVTNGGGRSNVFAYDGQYSVQINGDGTTEDPGHILQWLPISSGTRYVLSARAKVEGLTQGSLRADIYAGGTVIKELIWNADTDWTQKQIIFQFPTVPASVGVRVHGDGTPNSGAIMYCDDLLVERAADFEVAATGSDIVTLGTVNVTPNVMVSGVTATTNSPNSSRSGTVNSPIDQDYESAVYAYPATATYSVELPALANGSKYRINEISYELRSTNASQFAIGKFTIQATSLFSGAEKAITEYSTKNTTFTKYTYTVPYLLESGTNEIVTLRFYLRTSATSSTAYMQNFKIKYTEMIDIATAKATSLTMYNMADPSRQMRLCNSLPPGYHVEINNDYTGAYKYTEPFFDENYTTVATIAGTVVYNSNERTITMQAGSSLIFPFDTMCPITGIPFLTCFVVSGMPQFSISETVDGTYYTVDSNRTTNQTDMPITRDLDHKLSLRLKGKNKYYLKIFTKTGEECEFGQLYVYNALDTMDVERFYIYATAEANTLRALVGTDSAGKCSLIATVKYNDADILS